MVYAPSPLTWQSRDDDASVWVVGDKDRVHEHGFCELTVALPCSGEGMLIASLKDGTGKDMCWTLSAERTRRMLTIFPCLVKFLMVCVIA